MIARLALVAPVLAALAASAGCSANPGTAGLPEQHENDPASEPVAETSSALSTVTRSTVIANAMQWVNAMLLYCQSPNGQPDGDTACSSTCQRESNAQWDPYRSDCSGFVSWAWELPAPGRVTSTFAPFDTTVSNTIQCSDMKPGDAVNRDSGGHMVLFEKWITPGTQAVFMEEPGCSSSTPYAHEFTSAVSCNGTDADITYEGTTFTAIRYINIVDDPVDGGTGSSSGSSSGSGSSGSGSSSGSASGSGSGSGSSSGSASGSGSGSASGSGSGSSSGAGGSNSSGGSTSSGSGSGSGGGDPGNGSGSAGASSGATGSSSGGAGASPAPTGTSNVVGDLGAPGASACDVAPGPARGGLSWLGGVALAGAAIARRRRHP